MVTIKKLMGLDVMKDMQLIAGKGGSDNVVKRIVTLDYEFVRAGSEYNSEWKDELVMTSFLYARGNPNLILAAVKRLAKEDAAGLIIRNVFHLDISEEVIRFANHENFPIYIAKDNMLYLEDLIFAFNDLFRRTEDKEHEEIKLREIMYSDIDSESIKQKALNINSYYGSSYYIYYIRPLSDTGEIILESRQNSGLRRKLMMQGDSLIRFNDGMFYIHTYDQSKPVDDPRMIWAKVLDLDPDEFRVGVSNRQNYLKDYKSALLQSVYAFYYADIYGKRISQFSETETYQILFMSDNYKWHKQYLEKITEPIMEYDDNVGSELWATLMQYEWCGGDVKKAADNMCIHENSLRYRIGKVFELFEKDRKDKTFETELFIAVKLYRIECLMQSEKGFFNR